MTESNAPPKLITQHNPAIPFLAGAAAGMFADSIVHPIDTIRARIQVQRVHEATYKGTLDAVQQIMRKEGWRTFYRGFGIVVAFTTPAHALYFLGYEAGKRYIQPNKPMSEKGPLVHFTAGVIAEVLGAVIWTPMDVVKQRLQIQNKNSTVQYRNSLHGIKSLVKEEGFRGLFRGFGPGIATYAPFVGLYFVFYEKGKRIGSLISGKDAEHLAIYYHLASGFISGGLAAGFTCPLDVIKTRIQVQSANQPDVYTSGWHAFKNILKEEGPKAFIKGMVPRMLWIAPGTALTIASYEQFKRGFQFLFSSEPY